MKKGRGFTLVYTCLDGDGQPLAGDAANHTLYWIKDGVAAQTTNSPEEVSVNTPGEYRVAITDAEADCWLGKLVGTSSTPGAAIVPEAVAFEETVVADLLAHTGFTEGGSMSVEALLRLLAARMAGTVRLKSGESNVYEVLDADDGATVVATVTRSTSTPYWQVMLS